MRKIWQAGGIFIHGSLGNECCEFAASCAKSNCFFVILGSEVIKIMYGIFTSGLMDVVLRMSEISKFKLFRTFKTPHVLRIAALCQ